MSIIKNIKTNKKKHFGSLPKENKKVFAFREQEEKVSALEGPNKNENFVTSANKAFSNKQTGKKQMEEKPLFVWSKKKPKQNLYTIGKRLIAKKIKKRRYRFTKQLKKLEIRYDLNKHRFFNDIKVFRKLKQQKSSSTKLIKKLKLRISRFLKHKHSKHQSRKLNLYINIFKRLKSFRKNATAKIIYIIQKKHLYAHSIKKAEIKKSYKPKNQKPKAKLFYG